MIDYLTAVEPKKIESVRIETPLGSLESDSGNHTVDVLTIGAFILVGYLLKRMYFGSK